MLETIQPVSLFASKLSTNAIELDLNARRYPLSFLVIVGDKWLKNTIHMNYLTQFGYGSGLASDFNSGLKMLRENKFDVVIIDDKVQGISTEDLALKIKEIDPEVALILCKEGSPIGTTLDNIDVILNEPQDLRRLKAALRFILPDEKKEFIF